MKRQQLEHILRAAAGITGADQFVVIGSQAIPGEFSQTPIDDRIRETCEARLTRALETQ